MIYRRLLEEQRTSRRTIADALEVLRSKTAISELDQAELLTAPLPLPSGETPSLVVIKFIGPDAIYLVALPTARKFKGRQQGSMQLEQFDSEMVNGASVNCTGAITLADGRILIAVEIVPATLPLKPSILDWRIVHLTVEFLRAEGQCYRSLRHGLLHNEQDRIEDLRFLDCSKLLGLKVPCLEAIAKYLASKDKTLRRLSPQKIADALRKFGMASTEASASIVRTPRFCRNLTWIPVAALSKKNGECSEQALSMLNTL